MGEATLPAPPVPVDCDLRGLPYLPLDVIRLRDSDLTISMSGEEFRAAVLLWCASWHQIPAGSLPDDDRALAHFAGVGRDHAAWSKIKGGALHGFIRCSDGRLYHPVVCEKALIALGARHKEADRRESDRQRKRRERQSNTVGAGGPPAPEVANEDLPDTAKSDAGSPLARPDDVPRTSGGHPDDVTRNSRPKLSKGKGRDNAPPAAHLPDMNDPKVQLFQRGKDLLGPSSGGLINRLLAAKENSVPAARAALETASTRADPREYLGAIIQSKPPPSDGRPVRKAAI